MRYEVLTRDKHKELLEATRVAVLQGSVVVGQVVMDTRVSNEVHQVITWPK
jgi:hypothetical protein